MNNICFNKFMEDMRPLLQALLDCEEKQQAPHTPSGTRIHPVAEALEDVLAETPDFNVSAQKYLAGMPRRGSDLMKGFPSKDTFYLTVSELKKIGEKANLSGRRGEIFTQFMVRRYKGMRSDRSPEEWANIFNQGIVRAWNAADEQGKRIIDDIDKSYRGWEKK